MSEIDVVAGVLRRQRAHRRFTDQSVPDETLTSMLELATRAPSAQNQQPWHFIVIRDESRRAAIWELAARMWHMGASDAAKGTVSDDVHQDVDYGVTEGFASAPISIVVAVDTHLVDRGLSGSSIWPAAQNLMIAATAHGLGSALTTIGTFLTSELRALVAMPEHVDPVAVIPIGHPARQLGSSRREPVKDHAHREEFGHEW